MANKSYTVIGDLVNKLDIEDSNLIIVEDAEDTKQSTISELKKNFSGDYSNPSENKFYSSQKIKTLLDDLKRELSTFASDDELKEVKERIADIIAANGTGKDSEIVDARNGYRTLATRLANDIADANDKFVEKFVRTVEGTQVSTGFEGYVDIYLKNMSGSTANINFNSRNILDITANSSTDEVVYNDNGFTYTQLKDTTLSASLKFRSSLPKGTYYFYTNISYDDLFADKGDILLVVRNSNDESAYTEFTYNQNGRFEFTASKAFNEIKLIFNKDNYVLGSKVEFKNIMLLKEDTQYDYYIPYASYSVPIAVNNHIRGYNEDYIITCSDKSASIVVTFYDKAITMNTIQDQIDELNSIIVDKRDKCGLITNYGQYLFFDDVELETVTSARLAYDNDKFMRNGTPSLKLTFNEDTEVNPLFKIAMKAYVETVNSVSLVFYMDRTDWYYFETSEPIRIYLCSDGYNEPDMVNYLTTTINKSELVQGWNIIKKNINDFESFGKPNNHGIQYVKIEVVKNTGLDNRSMYLNSIIFNQKMKPTVLLAFDGIYEDAFAYTYPYLTSRNVPATILSNNRTTFSSNILNSVVTLRTKHGWDLGQYACNPNKELLTNDDNSREQYLALKTTRTWLENNLIFNPISFSAPFGNLRPITAELLKDMGYKIAKTDSTGYCNFFDPKYDFAIPMTLMSNETTEDEIISKIQYAIDNDCCICLYTNNVTNYGDEASSKKSLFETVVKFILANSDKITPMTFAEFYNKCNS